MDDDRARGSGTSPVGWWRTRRGWVEAVGIVGSSVLLVFLLVDLVHAPGPRRGGGERTVRTTAVTTTSTTLGPEAQAEQAYQGFWAMSARLAERADPTAPEIAQRTTGELRKDFERVLADRRSKGRSLKVGPQTRLTILSTNVTDRAATMKGCFVDQSAVVDASTGAEIESMTTVTELETATAVLEEGVWKLSSISTDDDHRWQGVYDCGA